MARLVLADTNPTVQKIVQLCFGEDNHEVLSFTDGNSALAHFDSETADILLADASLVGLNGYELCRRLRQNPVTAHIPVVLLVGARVEFDPVLARQVGCECHLAKPVDTFELVALVEGLIQESGKTASAAKLPVNSPVSRKTTGLNASNQGLLYWELGADQCDSYPPVYHRCEEDPGPSAMEKAPSGIASPTVGSALLLDRLVERLRQELPRILEDAARDLQPGNKP